MALVELSITNSFEKLRQILPNLTLQIYICTYFLFQQYTLSFSYILLIFLRKRKEECYRDRNIVERETS